MAESTSSLTDIDPAAQIKRFIRSAKRAWFRLTMFALVGLILGTGISTFVPELYETQTLLVLRERDLIENSRLLRAIEEKPLREKEAVLELELKSFTWVHDVLQQVEWLEYAEVRGDNAAVRELVEKVRDRKYFNVDISTDPAGDLLVTIIFRWFDPVKAHDFVLRTRKNWIGRRDRENRSYYQRKLAEASKILDERRRVYESAATSLERFESDHNLTVSEEQNPDLELKTVLLIDLEGLRSKTKEVSVTIRGLQEQLDKTDEFFVEELEEINPKYVAAEAQLALQRETLDKLLKQYKETHPSVKKARDALTKAQESFDEVSSKEFSVKEKKTVPNEAYTQLKNELDRLNPSLIGMRERMNTVERQLAEVNRTLSAKPILLNTWKRLENDYEVAREAYNDVRADIAPLQDRVSNWENQSAGMFGDSEAELSELQAFQILEEPVIPKDPTGVPKMLYPIAGFGIFLGIGLALLFLRELTRITYEDPDEVQRGLNLPVLGSIAHIATALELRRERIRAVMSVAGGVLIVSALGVFVYIVTSQPDMLPSSLREQLEVLKTTFQ